MNRGKEIEAVISKHYKGKVDPHYDGASTDLCSAIRNLAIVSSPYNLFLLEEEGHLKEKLDEFYKTLSPGGDTPPITHGETVDD